MTTIGPHDSTLQPIPTALTASQIALRILLILNWLYGPTILIGIIASFAAEKPVNDGAGASSVSGDDAANQGMRAMALLGLVTIPLHYVILRRLLDVIESVRASAPFAGQNASRLNRIAWALLGLQLLSIVIGAIAEGSNDGEASVACGCWLLHRPSADLLRNHTPSEH